MVAGGYPSDDEEQLIQNQGPMGGQIWHSAINANRILEDIGVSG